MSNKAGNSLIASLLAFLIMVGVLIPLMGAYSQTIHKAVEIKEKLQKVPVDETAIIKLV